MISALVFVFGIYLFFIGEEVTGTISIVVALLIFPRGKRSHSNDFNHDHDNNDSAHDSDSGSSDSDGGEEGND